MDWDLWLRLSNKYKFVHIDATLSKFKLHDDSKSVKKKERFLEEQKRILHLHNKNAFSKVSLYAEYMYWKIKNQVHKIF